MSDPPERSASTTTVSISYQFTFQEYLGLTRFLVRRNRLIRIIVVVWILLIVFYVAMLIAGARTSTTTVLMFVMGASLVVYFWIWLPRRLARKQYKDTNRIIEPISVRIDDKWIATSGETFESRVRWEKIYKIDERDDWFLIYENKALLQVILPKRAMSDEDVRNLRSIARGQTHLRGTLFKED